MQTPVITKLNVVLTLVLLTTTGCNPGASPKVNSRSSPGPGFDKSYQEVLTQVTSIVADTLRLTREEIQVDAPLSKQKNAADELDVVEIVMMVEDAYQIKITDEELGDNVSTNLTVRNLADIVIKRKQQK